MSPKIGNVDSARHRLMRFLDRAHDYLGRCPQRVTLFAEDFDALSEVLDEQTVEIVRGPSVEEYRQ